MAAEVEDVDLIVGGHSHTFLFSGEQYLNLLQNFLKCNFLIWLKDVFFQNLLEACMLSQIFVFEVGDLRSSPIDPVLNKNLGLRLELHTAQRLNRA